MKFGIDEIHRMIDALDRSETDFRKTAKALNTQCGKPSGNTFERFADECKGITEKLYKVLDTREQMEVE